MIRCRFESGFILYYFSFSVSIKSQTSFDSFALPEFTRTFRNDSEKLVIYLKILEFLDVSDFCMNLCLHLTFHKKVRAPYYNILHSVFIHFIYWHVDQLKGH